MTKSHHPKRLTIRTLASLLEHDLLKKEEKTMLAYALRVMADGGDFEQALGAKRPQGRPRDNRALYGVQRVATLMLKPSGAPFGDLGGEGLTKAAAIERVAGELSIDADISFETLEDAYKSKPGQAVRKQVEEAASGFDVLIDTPLE